MHAQNTPDKKDAEERKSNLSCELDLALAGFEAPVRLVDDVEAAAPAHYLIVTVPTAQ